MEFHILDRAVVVNGASGSVQKLVNTSTDLTIRNVDGSFALGDLNKTSGGAFRLPVDHHAAADSPGAAASPLPTKTDLRSG